MSIDIKAIDSNKAVNSINMILSTSPTGFSSKKTVNNIVSVENQIENIESKFEDKFDDPVYYFDDCERNVLGV
jgi:hypothetical protein